MSMIDPVTLSLVKSALDAGTLRQAVHAHNVANANTPGFRPFRVLFEQQPGGAPTAEVTREGTASVSVDTEVAALSRNALHYQALTDALGRHYALMSMAISEGRS